jgi:hypothetical protein
LSFVSGGTWREYEHLTDLSGEGPVTRLLFFLFVAGVILAGFLYVMKKGRTEDLYIHPPLKRLIGFMFRKKDP